MTTLSQIIGRYQRKTLLIAVAVALLAVNVGRLTIGHYRDSQAELENKIALLQQYRISTARLAGFKARITRIERQKKRLEGYLFTGESEEDISSAMQIMLQEKVVKAGLEPESIRPVRNTGSAKGRDYNEIAIKVRLSGTLSDFVAFVADIYKSQYLFKIESFTLKPYKKEYLKVFVEINGYYRLSKNDSAAAT